jgi:hypothetical protein
LTHAVSGKLTGTLNVPVKQYRTYAGFLLAFLKLKVLKALLHFSCVAVSVSIVQRKMGLPWIVSAFSDYRLYMLADMYLL